MPIIRKLAWIYAVIFFIVFVLTHAPGLTDAQGLNFGLFKIDPVDDLVHLLTAIVGALVAWCSTRLSVLYLWVVGILYNLDAAAGLFAQRGLLDGSIFTQGLGTPSFDLVNLALNLPHVAIASFAIIAAFVWGRTSASSKV